MTTRRVALRRAAAATVALLMIGACSGGGGSDEQDSESSEKVGESWDFVTRPDLTPPKIDVEHKSDTASKGLYFLAPKDEGAPMNGPLIVDESGEPVWAHPIGDRWSYDLRVQRYKGKPVLTWWRGDTHPEGYGEGEFVIMDRSYREIRSVRTQGTAADFHEATLTSRGTVLLINYPTVRQDLTEVDGPKDGYMLNSTVQEIDLDTGKVVFEWSAKDHIPLTDTQVDAKSDEDETGTKDGPFDPYHFNAVTEDGKNSLLITARNTHAVYRVNRNTGKLDWTLGGSSSDFKMVGNSEFAWQHDAQRQPDGTITLFDNEAAPPVGDEARGLRLDVDTKTDEARVVTEYLPSDGKVSDSQGNMQQHPDGTITIGWGSEPRYSEYSRDGELLMDATLSGGQSYRAYRLPWNAQPAEGPRFVLEDGTGYVSWNGATEVASWRFVAGDDPASAKTVKTVPRDGFETSTKMPDRPYIAAQALDSDGKLLATAEPGSWP